MTEVRATERGYYGSMVREPGEVFTVAEGVTGKWFEPIHPLDHDGDGTKGGVKNTETGLAGMTVAQLRDYAAAKNIDLGDATKKSDIIAAIELAGEAASDGTKGGDHDGGAADDDI